MAALKARIFLGMALGMALVESWLNLQPLPRLVPALSGTLPLIGGLLLWGGGALGYWLWRPSRGSGLLLALPLSLGAIVEGLFSPSGVHHGKLLPTLVLLAWSLAGRQGREAASGVAAAVYVLAALSKFLGSGSAWFTADHLGLLMVERSVGAPEPLALLRLGLAGHPGLCMGLASGAWLAEAAGFLLLWPRFRYLMAIVLTILHLGIFLGMGYFYLSWVLTLWALATAESEGASSNGSRWMAWR